MERVRGIEPLSTGWKPVVIAIIRHPPMDLWANYKQNFFGWQVGFKGGLAVLTK